ncbi:MAG: DUF3656 domain-containing protein [Coriobacteriales bacterium]
MRKPELLAPAGNREAFEAALAAGADAVYLGAGEGFNARCNADNFAPEDLEAACRDAHLRGRKVYLTANTLVYPGEMDQALGVVYGAAEAGIDAAIIQDVGLAQRLREELPQLELHTSTQMNIRDAKGIELARKLGFGRVTLARELSVGQIAKLAQLGMDLEVFVHGALCICQSGQCLLSSLIGGRSANRGVCAQPCRLPYTIVNEDGKKLADPGEYLLSPKDLMGIDYLPQLIAAGVASLKIEGRMKSAEYVSTAVGTYRAALDRAWLEEDGFEATAEEKAGLSEAFSRGFTPAYLVGERGNEMMGYKRPNNRGVLVGRVSGFRNGMVQVEASEQLEAGDLLEVWTSKGRTTYEVQQADDLRPGSVELYIRGAVSPGDRLFRIRSAALARECRERTQEGLKTVALRASVTAVKGQPLMVVVSDDKGNHGQAEGAVVEEARSIAITEDDVMEHVNRLGGTPYRIIEWDIQLDEGVGMGFSALHKCRAAAIAAYEEAVLDLAAHESRERGLACGTLDTSSVPQLADKMSAFVTRINFNETTSVAQTMSELEPGKATGPKLYATNPDALRVWAALGADFAWISPELTLAQIKQLADESPLPLGVVVHGRQELMVSDHCFLMAEGPCDGKCAKCKRRKGAPRYYKDRKGYLFPITADVFGRGHLYNAVKLDISHAIGDLRRAGVTGFAVDITLLEENEGEEQFYRARRALQGKPVEKEEGCTAGNLFRNRTGAKKTVKEKEAERRAANREQRWGKTFDGNRIDSEASTKAGREARTEYELQEARSQARAQRKEKGGVAGAKNIQARGDAGTKRRVVRKENRGKFPPSGSRGGKR